MGSICLLLAQVCSYSSHGPSDDPDAGTSGTVVPPGDASPPSPSPRSGCGFHDIAGGASRGVAVLRDDGTVWGWAWSDPVRRISGMEDIVSIGAQDTQVCGIDSGGSVVCERLFDDGSGWDLELTAPLPARAVKVAPSDRHACAVLEDGRVACWGYNYHGVLGIEADWEWYTDPVIVPGIDDAIDLAVGPDTTCAVRETGEVRCWGQPGVWLPDDLRARSVVVGPQNSGTVCAVRAEGGVGCWQLRPPVSGLETLDARRLFAGYAHYCAELGSGEVTCWGDNTEGALGPSAPRGFLDYLERLPGGGDALAIATGSSATCLLTDECTVSCLGSAESRDLPAY